jgi:hypothetical protein
LGWLTPCSSPSAHSENGSCHDVTPIAPGMIKVQAKGGTER